MWSPLLLVLFSAVGVYSFCKELNTTCYCAESTDSFSYTLKCPSFEASLATLEYKTGPNSRTPALDIKCNVEMDAVYQSFESHTEILLPKDMTFLPELSLGSLDDLKILNCPLDDTPDIFETLGIRTVKRLLVKEATFKNDYLNGEFFGNISETLEWFALKMTNLKRIDKGAFSRMKNLKTLELQNTLSFVSDEQFIELSNLNNLYVIENRQLNTLPVTCFQNLTKLLQLHLFDNGLTGLAEKTFSDLTNLMSLELSTNKILSFPERIFERLTNLRTVNIGKNNFSEISEEIFKNNKKLTSVRMEQVKNLSEIPEGLLRANVKLEIFKLSFTKIETLPERLFENTRKLITLFLNNNKIKKIQPKMLNDTPELKELRMSNNLIYSLESFTSVILNNLIKLDLSFNKLSDLPGRLFSSLNMEEINLSHNQLDSAYDLCNLKLRKLVLSHNNLTFGNVTTDLFNGCVNLEHLDLSFNKITGMSIELSTKPSLQYLNLDNNQLATADYFSLICLGNCNIYMRNNRIAQVNFSDAFYPGATGKTSTVYLDNNPIACDCQSLKLHQYLNNTLDPIVSGLVQLKAENLTCAGPVGFVNVELKKVPVESLVCKLNDEKCPAGCDCYERPFERYVVNCSNLNLSEIPRIREREKLQTLVELQGNRLRRGPKPGEGYENVTSLNLSHNVISVFDWKPKMLQKLDLSFNAIEQLDENVWGNFTDLYLRGNPWRCNCQTYRFSKYILKDSVRDKEEIRCGETDKSMIHMNELEFCPTNQGLVIAIIVIVSFLLIVVSVTVAFYYRYSQEIKVWLYARKWCLWFVEEEDLDRNKEYDAFVSFSQKDDEYVYELVRKLESGPDPYKICVHMRNWLVGEPIPKQIVESVNNSRRTIIVLSKDYQESVWGMMEFRTAHQKALREGRTRLIIIIKDDVELSKNLDNELEVYLKTNTYIKWNDPWFWNRLRYALPHKQKNQKMDNVMNNIDKLVLFNGQAMPNSLSTPPADPLLLKIDPLQFQPATNTTN